MARPVYVFDAVRTAIARGKPGGTLAGVHPVHLLSSTLKALQTRNGGNLPIGDVIAGCVTPVGVQGANVARLAALHAGYPTSIPGVQLNRMCGSGQQSVHFAAQAVAAGDMDLAVGCGVEMMGTVTMGSDTDLFDNKETPFRKTFPYKLIHQGVSAELMADKYGITREACDDYAIRSQELADKAWKRGFFDSQIVKVPLEGGGQLDRDEGVRFPVDEAKLRALKTVFKKEGGRVTAGNASQISDGAAAVLVGSAETGLKKRARILTRVVVGSDPVIMLDGVIPATQLALKKAGLSIKDIGVVEINEAFAVVVLSWLKEIGADLKTVNPNGGAIAHGHPLGASGGVLMCKLLAAMEEGGHKYGLQTMCIGHGQATATILELVDK